MTSNNMYRVGDFVYFEVSASAPYQIRKIEELNKTSTGAVEAKVVCFYRRRDLSVDLVQLADKHQKQVSDPSDSVTPDDLLRQIRHRELFLSRQLETLPATHIRGKCSVTLHNDNELSSSYMNKEDAFFFQLVYDPVQKTLQADRGRIRVGADYQADVPAYQPSAAEEGASDQTAREELCWKPADQLSTSSLNSYLLLNRSLGTLGRAYYPPTTLRQPSLPMCAASAARDSSLELALNTLNAANYDISRALQLLSPNGQPMVKLDEMESWSASEGNLFEEALEKYGKCFYDIQSDFLPWKNPKSIIEFYYMWKTTDHYIQQKRLKAAEAEHHLKQVYIPNYNKPNPAVLYPTLSRPDQPHQSPGGCEGCQCADSSQWYALGPASSPLKVCADCWAYWKRYGDLKVASVLDKVYEPTQLVNKVGAHAAKVVDLKPPHLIQPTINVTTNHHHQNQPAGTVKLPASVGFQFVASLAIRLVRRRLQPLLLPRRQARRPFKLPNNVNSPLQREFQSLLSDTQSLMLFGQKLKARRSVRSTNPRSRLKTLLPLIFSSVCRDSVVVAVSSPSADMSVAKFATAQLLINQLNKSNTNHRPLIYQSAEATTTTTPNHPNQVNGLSSNDVTVSNNNNNSTTTTLKRPKSPEIDINTVSAKRAHTLTTTEPSPSPTPKRRLDMGPADNGAHMLMFSSTERTKSKRRRCLSVSQMRRFGRRPHVLIEHPTTTDKQPSVAQPGPKLASPPNLADKPSAEICSSSDSTVNVHQSPSKPDSSLIST